MRRVGKISIFDRINGFLWRGPEQQLENLDSVAIDNTDFSRL